MLPHACAPPPHMRSSPPPPTTACNQRSPRSSTWWAAWSRPAFQITLWLRSSWIQLGVEIAWTAPWLPPTCTTGEWLAPCTSLVWGLAWVSHADGVAYRMQLVKSVCSHACFLNPTQRNPMRTHRPSNETTACANGSSCAAFRWTLTAPRRPGKSDSRGSQGRRPIRGPRCNVALDLFVLVTQLLPNEQAANAVVAEASSFTLSAE